MWGSSIVGFGKLHYKYASGREGDTFIIEFDLPARQAFAADGPLPTQTARLVPGAITIDEVRRA